MTAVMPDPARAREDALVAAPIDWFELDEVVGANDFTLKGANLLLERAGSKLLLGVVTRIG